jgi:hypothetical protein
MFKQQTNKQQCQSTTFTVPLMVAATRSILRIILSSCHTNSCKRFKELKAHNSNECLCQLKGLSASKGSIILRSRPRSRLKELNVTSAVRLYSLALTKYHTQRHTIKGRKISRHIFFLEIKTFLASAALPF